MMRIEVDEALIDEAANYLAVPLLLTVEPVRGRDGVWRLLAAYPEFPECHATSEMLTAALDRLEDVRRELTLRMLRSGVEPPHPRSRIDSFVPWFRREILRNIAEINAFGAKL